MEEELKILVYLGPSLPLARARQILPNAVYHPPARQGDIVTDVVNLNPNIIILIDGTFADNLSPWHKEIVFALQYPGVKAIYGAASMGALRAAELDYLGMIGIGQIYEWYHNGVTEDDSEVAVHYATREGPDGPLYYVNTVPLVDIRAGVEHYEREFPGEPVAVGARAFLEQMRGIYYMERTSALCVSIHADILRPKTESVEYEKTLNDFQLFPHLPQKEIDAIHALNDFRTYEPAPLQKPSPCNLSSYFQALYERDRRISIRCAWDNIPMPNVGLEIPQQHLDSYVLLHNPEYERICWDAANQELALMLCNQLCVMVSLEEIERESSRFQQKCGLETAEDFKSFLENNGWSRHEYDRVMIQNARVRKLQHSLTVTKMYRRNTQSILDYLRTHQGFDYWAAQAVRAEKQIAASGVDDWMGINLEKPVFTMLAEHMEKEGLDLKCSPEEYLLETGFSNPTELSVALSRISAGKEQDG